MGMTTIPDTERMSGVLPSLRPGAITHKFSLAEPAGKMDTNDQDSRQLAGAPAPGVRPRGLGPLRDAVHAAHLCLGPARGLAGSGCCRPGTGRLYHAHSGAADVYL